MPVITKREFNVCGERTVFRTTYRSQFSRFYLKLPKIAFVIAAESLVAKTVDNPISISREDWCLCSEKENALWDFLRRVIKVVEETSTKTRKVIVYRCGLHTFRVLKKGKTEKLQDSRDNQDHFCDDGICITLQCGCFDEESVSIDGFTTYRYRKLSSVFPDDLYPTLLPKDEQFEDREEYAVVDWTADLEKSLAQYIINVQKEFKKYQFPSEAAFLEAVCKG